MSIIYGLTVLFNILTIVILSIGLFVNFKNPKNKAAYGYLIAAGMIPYLVLMCLTMILKLFYEKNCYYLILILSILSPFVIGKIVKYETLKKYTVIQIICFILSLVILFF